MWGAVIFAELLALFLSWYCFARNRKKYGYAWSAEGRDFTVSYSHEYNAIESLIGCAYHEAALKMHLADSELCILYTLHTHGPGCLQSTLYKETGLTKTTVNSALKKLEKGGTLYLTPGPGRNTRVYLTESGAQLARDTAGRLMELENRIYASWTPRSRRSSCA